MTRSEEWRPVMGYEGAYEVSDQGRVRSLPRYGTAGGIRKLGLRKDGYLQIELSAGNKKRNWLVHRLVASAFCPREPHEHIARHLNDVRTDNRAVNLAWGTLSDNVQDCIRNGLHPRLNKTECPQGHPYDETNTVRDGRGHRQCRECGRVASRLWAAAKRRRDREVAA